MDDPASGDVTRLLRRVRDGEREAWEELLPLIYQQLRSIARRCMEDERGEHTLQPTALVHEAWLRLRGSDKESWEDRGRFLGVASRAMRNVLVDHARKRGAAKRGGGGQREPLDHAVGVYEERGLDLIALNDALAELEEVDPDLVQVVELRFFAGLEHAEVAEVTGSSQRSVERSWATARAFLGSRLDGAPG